MMRSIGGQASRFIVIGLVGFVVDAGVLLLLHERSGFGLVGARFISFPVAVSVTWYLNRRWTFHDRQSNAAAAEWGRYAVVNSAGAVINMGIFLVLVSQSAAMAARPLIALGLAAGVSLVFNFIASRQIAFRGTGT